MEKNSISVCVNEKDESNDAQNREPQKLLFGWWTIAERQKGVMVIPHQKYLWVTRVSTKAKTLANICSP